MDNKAYEEAKANGDVTINRACPTNCPGNIPVSKLSSSDLREEIANLPEVSCIACPHDNDEGCDAASFAVCKKELDVLMPIINAAIEKARIEERERMAEEVRKVKTENPNEQQSDEWYKEAYEKGDSGYVAEGAAYRAWM